MSKRSFPLKDLFRRRFQTAVTILSLTTATTTTFFLLFFGDNIGFEVILLTGGRLTSGFSYIFSIVLLITTLLTFLTGVLVMSFFISLAMHERVRDVGIMKAVGCLTDLVFGYFIAELSIMVFVSCVTGFILGMLLSSASISILNTLGFVISQKPFNIWIIPPAFLAFLIVPHLLGARAIGKALLIKPSQALSTSYSLGTPQESKISAPSRLGLRLKTAYTTLARRRIATYQAIMCLALVFALTTVALTGGTIANQTTQSYVERAIQKNVVLIGQPEVSRRYVDLLSSFSEIKETEPINYLDSKLFIPEALISRLSLINGIDKVDPRLILETRVYEIPHTIIEPDRYIVIGDHRSSDALVLGLEPESAVNNWLVLGRSLNTTDSYSVMVGDSLASSMFRDPTVQGMELLSKDFQITGVCQDPFNNGNVVYVPLQTLRSLVSQDESNLLLLLVDESKLSQALAQIGEEVAGTGLEIVELNDVLQRHIGFLNSAWSLVTLAPLFSLVTAVLCLSGYMTLLISTQRRDLAIMRAVGAKMRAVTVIVLVQALMIVLASGAVGLSVGLVISSLLLPEPVVSLASVLPILLWFFMALVVLGVCSLYPTLRTLEKSVIRAVSEL